MAYYEYPPKGSGGSAGKAFTAMSDSDPNVVALWNFDEASGEFVDSVNSLELARIGTLSIATYSKYEINKFQVTDGGLLKNIAPGYVGLQQRLTKTGVNATLSPGTGSFSVELYGQFGFDQTIAFPFYFYNLSDTAAFFVYFARDGSFWARVWANDGTFVTANTAAVHEFTNMECKHLRIAYDAGSTLKIFLDGTEVASNSAASLSGKTVEIDDIYFGGTATHNNAPALFYQIRISHNATNDGYGYE